MKTIALHLLAFVLRSMVRLLGRIIYRLRIEGVQNVPSQGGAILVANHTSYMDFVLLVCSIPRYVRFIMNADVFHKPGLKFILQGLNCIPVSPRGGKNKFEAFNAAVKAQLDAGHVVAIFAEGTVTRTGQILEFKRGIEHLSKLSDAPIVPIHFDNVSGTPFSYRAGMRHMIRIHWRSLRKKVFVKIGTPIPAPVSAFDLRQRIKEMEAENFSRRIGQKETLSKRIQNALEKQPTGAWVSKNGSMAYSSITEKLGLLGEVLQQPLSGDRTVALLLPKNEESFLINLFLILNHKSVVNINPNYKNEERFSIMNQCAIQTLITTKDDQFTHYAPYAKHIIYVEDIKEAIVQHKPVNVVCKNIKTMRSEVGAWLTRSANNEAPATILFEKNKEGVLEPVVLTQKNIIAVIESLRQIHFFDKSNTMLSDLGFYTSYGFVLEMLLPLISDITVFHCSESTGSEAFVELLNEKQCSTVLTTPSQLRAIGHYVEKKNLPFLTTIFTAEVSPNSALVQSLLSRNIHVMNCAGLNVTSSVFAINHHNYHGADIVGKPMFQEAFQEGSIGKPLPGIAVRVVNEKGIVLGANELGCLEIKGAAVVSYQVMVWVKTNMTGLIDQRGFIHLQSMNCENIITGISA